VDQAVIKITPVGASYGSYLSKAPSHRICIQFMPQPEKSPLADEITQIGDRADKILAAAQSSASKVFGRLLKIIGGMAVAIVLLWQAVKGFQEKTAPIIEKSGVETVEQKQGSKVFRVKGR
jgi:hypothetical protein